MPLFILSFASCEKEDVKPNAKVATVSEPVSTVVTVEFVSVQSTGYVKYQECDICSYVEVFVGNNGRSIELDRSLYKHNEWRVYLTEAGTGKERTIVIDLDKYDNHIKVNI